MNLPHDDPSIRDITAPPPVPTAAEFRQAVSVVIHGIAAASAAHPDLLAPATADGVAWQIAHLPALVGFLLHGGPMPRPG